MVRWTCLPGLIGLLVLEGCSHAPGDGDSPALPRLTIAGFRPQVRDQVQTAYREAEAKPRDAAANGRLGMLLHAFEQYESAELCYRRARMVDPSRFQWAYYLGLVQAINGRNEQAAASLQDAIRLDAGYLPARLKLAEVLLIAGRLQESGDACQSMLKDAPQLAPVHYWSGRVASAGGQTAAAMEHYRKACQLWPSYGTAHYALALLCHKSGATAEAETHMAAYQKYKADGDPQPEDPLLEGVRALDNTALAHLMKGVDLASSGKLTEAIAEHEKAVRQDPRLAQAQANLIGLYARAGRTDMVEAAYRATVGINPNLPQSHYDYGVFLASRQRFQEAEAAFRQALANSPNYAEAHSNLGAMLERRGQVEEAIRHYQAAIESKPNFRQAHFQLGRVLLMKKKTTQAIEQLSQTLTPEDSDTPRFMYALGIAYAEAGDYANAERYLRDAGGRATSSGQDQLAMEVGVSLRKVEEKAAR